MTMLASVGRTMLCKTIRVYTKVGLSSVVILAGLEAADEMTEACRTFPVRDECALEPPKGLSLVMVEHNQPTSVTFYCSIVKDTPSGLLHTAVCGGEVVRMLLYRSQRRSFRLATISQLSQI